METYKPTPEEIYERKIEICRRSFRAYELDGSPQSRANYERAKNEVFKARKLARAAIAKAKGE